MSYLTRLMQQEAQLARELAAARKANNIKLIEELEDKLDLLQDDIEDATQDEYEDKRTRDWY